MPNLELTFEIDDFKVFDSAYSFNKDIYNVLKSMPEQLKRYERLGFDKTKSFEENFQDGFRFVTLDSKKLEKTAPVKESDAPKETVLSSQPDLMPETAVPYNQNITILPNGGPLSEAMTSANYQTEYENGDNERLRADDCFDQFEAKNRGTLTSE